jgi:hypothetical protein
MTSYYFLISEKLNWHGVPRFLLEDGYVNFYQGSYQVTLSADDNQAETVIALQELARLVAGRLSAPPLKKNEKH